jgi:hypothetical protein
LFQKYVTRSLDLGDEYLTWMTSEPRDAGLQK